MKRNETERITNPGTPSRHQRAAFAAPWMFTGLMLAALLISVTSSQAGAGKTGGKRGVDVMQANLYVGGGTGRVMTLDPSDPAYLQNLVSTVTGVFYEIVASRPEIRLQAVADEIAARMPEVVAVQEASLIRNQSPGDLVVGGTTPATNVVYDYLAMLVGELAARGAHYAVASSIEELDAEMPMLNLQTGAIDDVRLTDRDAILVRTDLPPGQMRVSNPQGGHFVNRIQIPAIGLNIWRGWCSVDLWMRGEPFRFVNAHLEEETAPQIQMLQAQELLRTLANWRTPLLLAGDFNADPLHRTGATLTYDLIVAAGFKDAWAATHPLDLAGGLTWGHDELLADPGTAFVWRLDYIFYRAPGFCPVSATVRDLGLDRTAPPLWASDHAALGVSFLFQPCREPKLAVKTCK